MKKTIILSVAIILASLGVIVYGFSNKSNILLGATVLFPGGGGTGTSTIPSYGQMLVGNAGGTYTLTATSALGIVGTGGTGGGPTDQLGQIGDVSTSTLAWGHLLMWNNTDWQDTATSSLGISQWTSYASGIYYNGGNTVSVGSSTLIDRFPKMRMGVSDSWTGHWYTGSVALFGEAASDGTDTSTGVGGVAATNGNYDGRGIVGVGKVLATADTGNAIGVQARATDTHAGGNNISVYANATGGLNNYSFYGNAGTFYNAGNIGIGTTSPYEKLSVVGNAYVSGDIYGGNVNYNEGMIEEVTITDADGVAVAITEADCEIRSDSTWNDGRLYRKTVAASSSLPMTDDAINYIVVEWNNGTPEYRATTTRNNINNSNTIPVARIYMESGDIEYQMDYGEVGKSVAIRNFDRVMRTRGNAGIERESGLALSESATRVINSAAGYAWFGMDRKSLDAIVQTAGNSHIWYHSSGNWTEDATSTYNNLYYDNGTNLTALTANRYAVNWIYRNVTNGEIDIVLGTGDYTLAQAEASTISSIPNAVNNFYVLVGRIIVQKSANTATAIESITNTVFTQSAVSVHSELSNLDYASAGHTGFQATITNLSPTLGGTGLTAFTNGSLLYASAANTWAALASSTYGSIMQISATGYPSWVASTSVYTNAFSDLTWTSHNSYPTACAAGAGVVTGIGDTLTCTATSTLGIRTKDLIEDTNLFWTQARFDTALLASTSIPGLTAGKATALASDPSDCAAGQFANAIAANGNLTCAATSTFYVFDGSGDCGTGLVCTGGHEHSTYVYTAGDALTLNGNDFDFDGGASPGGTLGGTWASPTVDSDGTWTVHDSYPAACSAGQYVSTIGDTLTCSAPSTLGYITQTYASSTFASSTGATITGTTTITNLSFSGLINQVSTTIVGVFQKIKAVLSLIIPIDKYLDTQGQIAIDTTTGQLRSHTGSATTTYPAYQFPAFTYATSTAWTGTTTIPLGPAFQAETWSSVKCFTNTGTTSVQFGDGTNKTALLLASTTVNTITLSSNNTFTAGEKRYVDMGTPSGSPTSVSCTVKKSIDPD